MISDSIYKKLEVNEKNITIYNEVSELSCN